MSSGDWNWPGAICVACGAIGLHACRGYWVVGGSSTSAAFLDATIRKMNDAMVARIESLVRENERLEVGLDDALKALSLRDAEANRLRKIAAEAYEANADLRAALGWAGKFRLDRSEPELGDLKHAVSGALERLGK